MADHARRDAFQAIADPTRRKIIDLVSREFVTVSTIATKLKMSQPAISQQLKILAECGIIQLETVGRERYCKINTRKLVPAFRWLDQYQKQWTDRIDSFEEYVNDLHAKTKKTKK